MLRNKYPYPVTSEIVAEPEPRSRGRQRAVKLTLGAVAAASLAATAFNFDAHTRHEVAERAPWVLGALVGTEVAWNAGAAIALGAVGLKIGNPLTIRSRFKEVAAQANHSFAFHAGMVINTAGAAAAAGVVAAGITTGLPVESWGLLAVPAMDLAGTVALRALIYQGVRHAASEVELNVPPMATGINAPPIALEIENEH
jgi:hypothetical protein